LAAPINIVYSTIHKTVSSATSSSDWKILSSNYPNFRYTLTPHHPYWEYKVLSSEEAKLEHIHKETHEEKAQHHNIHFLLINLQQSGKLFSLISLWQTTAKDKSNSGTIHLRVSGKDTGKAQPNHIAALSSILECMLCCIVSCWDRIKNHSKTIFRFVSKTKAATKCNKQNLCKCE
jgi:hypothetical protein